MVGRKSYCLLGLVASMLFLGCSSNSTPSNQTAEDTANIYESSEEQNSQPFPNVNVNLDSLRANSISDIQNNSRSGIDVSVNPYYDAGYEQGQEDGYDDGIENLRGDSYDDSSRYKGKARREYELGYEEGYEAGFDDGFADSDYDSEDEE